MVNKQCLFSTVSVFETLNNCWFINGSGKIIQSDLDLPGSSGEGVCPVNRGPTVLGIPWSDLCVELESGDDERDRGLSLTCYVCGNGLWRKYWVILGRLKSNTGLSSGAEKFGTW